MQNSSFKCKIHQFQLPVADPSVALDREVRYHDQAVRCCEVLWGAVRCCEVRYQRSFRLTSLSKAVVSAIPQRTTAQIMKLSLRTMICIFK